MNRGGVTLLIGDAREQLQTLPAESVDCVVTSPPYWGLRDYGVGGQLGLEATPEEYTEKMVGIFAEARRVLKKTGTLWLNIGDCYTRQGGDVGGGNRELLHLEGKQHRMKRLPPASDLKPKDLVGMPWRVAFALQAAGWFLRQDIIWAKPNPMPESVRDRCTKSHEYLFLLSRSARYYFDSHAMSEPAASAATRVPAGWAMGPGSHDAISHNSIAGRSGNKERKSAHGRGVPCDGSNGTNGAVAGSVPWEGHRRNRRSVWSLPTEAFSGAHFATFPTRLALPCILAGCPVGGVVLDPFAGSGTTLQVAAWTGRHTIGIELNPAYAPLVWERVAKHPKCLEKPSRRRRPPMAPTPIPSQRALFALDSVESEAMP